MENSTRTRINTDEDTCSCGHDHTHAEHDHEEHESLLPDRKRKDEFADVISCSCGHDHSHEEHESLLPDRKRKDEFADVISCSCGHDHTHAEHDHEEHESLLPDRKRKDEFADVISCSCGHDHSHAEHDHEEHDHEEHSHQSITDGVGCSCGHCHDEAEGEHDNHAQEGHSHDHGEFGAKQKAIFAGSFVVAAAGILLPLPSFMKLIFVAAGTLMAGYPLFIDGLKSMRRFSFDETMLLTVAVAAAFAIGEYPEAFIVTALFRVGNLLENAAVARSKRDIEALTQIRPDRANVLLEDGKTKQAWAEDVEIDTKILVKPGEKIPLDAVILEGTTSLDTSALTGESIARNAEVGDTVLSGTVNLDGVIVCKTINSFDKSAASRIIEMVKESAAKKGKTENLISRFAKVYTPFIIVAAAALAFIPPMLGLGELTQWVSRSLVFLVASCPCALVISIPLSFFAGVGANSKIGVLVKGSKYIETLASVNAVVMDKTGTLTTGKLTVSSVVSVSALSEAQVLELAAKAESYSNHPMAQAVVAKSTAVDLSDVTNYSEIPGKGTSLSIDGNAVLCGSFRLMKDNGIDVSSLPAANIYIAQNGEAVGYITMFDEPRPEAAQAVAELKALGIEQIVMLTGDEEIAAMSVKDKCGLDAAYAQLLPEDKVERLEEVKSKYGVTVFVGDGINDAPVLARSDAGIAMGFGTDAAIESSDIVLMSENLMSLVQAIRLSRRTVAIAKFNIIFALTIKAIVLVLGAAGMAAMWMAVFADVGVSVLAVLNATRILRVKK